MQSCFIFTLLLSYLSTRSDARCLPGLDHVDLLDLTDRHIVTLYEHVDLAAHIEHAHRVHAEIASSVAFEKAFLGVTHSFNISSFKAYAGHFHPAFVDHLAGHSEVKWVEKDETWTVADLVTQRNARALNLGQISHRYAFRAADGYVYDPVAGSGTYAYVVDSGIDLDNSEFEGRASAGYTALSNRPMRDTAGHGTHVAGIIGGKTFGVAKHTRLVAVKVLERRFGSTSLALDGFQWASNDIVRKRLQHKAVINMSLVGPQSKAINSALDASYELGVSTVVAGGSTGFAGQAYWSNTPITVGASDGALKRASFSVDSKSTTLYAPGVGIRAAWVGGPDAQATTSGTSSAAAHVSGLVVYLKSIKRLPDAKQTKQTLIMLATVNTLKDVLRSQNLFAYNGSDSTAILQTICESLDGLWSVLGKQYR